MNNTAKKDVLIGLFIKKKDIIANLTEICKTHNIDINHVFIFEIETNDEEYLVTFRAFGRREIIKSINNSLILHTKNSCIFSINALNKLIEQEVGKVDTKAPIDWGKYKNKLIILAKYNLKIENTKRVYLSFDKQSEKDGK